MIRYLLVLFILFVFGACQSNPETKAVRKIVLLAGPKSHPPGFHEYLKSVRLIKAMLENANVDGLKVEIVNGWPESPNVFEDADLVVTISDGYDGRVPDSYAQVPWEDADRMEIMNTLMERGCGFSTIHFSTFMDDKKGARVLEWGGGYFDWQDDQGDPNWYSAIKTIQTKVTAQSFGDHPILNGVKPFEIKEEFYYNIRFREDDPRLIPILHIPDLETDQERGQVVAWTVQRNNGGRGFSTTMGHFYSNWENDNYRKLMLNGIVWAAGAEVPIAGVEAKFYTDREVTKLLYGKTKKGLILTGNNHPAHDWKATTPVLKKTIEDGSDLLMDVTTDPNDLYEYDLRDYDMILVNYCNWKDSTGLSERAKKSFVEFLEKGGGLVLVHFANGAFHYSLPEAGGSDWPEFRKIVPRVWDHQAGSRHDKYGEFVVEPTAVSHPITAGIEAFETTDELYFKQAGDIPIEPLLQAKSKITGSYEPLAWTHTYGKARVFQILLGHSVQSLSTPEVEEMIRRASIWTTGGKMESNNK